MEQVLPLQAAFRKLQGGKYKTSHLAQGDRAEVIVFLLQEIPT